jgi:hypothetical protein
MPARLHCAGAVLDLHISEGTAEDVVKKIENAVDAGRSVAVSLNLSRGGAAMVRLHPSMDYVVEEVL